MSDISKGNYIRLISGTLLPERFSKTSTNERRHSLRSFYSEQFLVVFGEKTFPKCLRVVYGGRHAEYLNCQRNFYKVYWNWIQIRSFCRAATSHDSIFKIFSIHGTKTQLQSWRFPIPPVWRAFWRAPFSLWRIIVDGRTNRGIKAVFLNFSCVVWTKPVSFLFFYVPVVVAVVIFLNSLMFYHPLVFLVISSAGYSVAYQTLFLLLLLLFICLMKIKTRMSSNTIMARRPQETSRLIIEALRWLLLITFSFTTLE